MIRRLIAIGALALAACATDANKTSVSGAAETEAASRSRYTSDPGPTPVGAIPDAALRDPQRDREILLNIDYPTRGGPHPLLIWSHAGGGSNRAYTGLSSHWAGYGYVVIRPAHGDSPENEEPAAEVWRNRVRDVTFVLDSLDALEQKYPELQGKIDRSRIGVGGHARGAVTAMQLGGLQMFPGPVSSADARVKAIVAMSPPGPRESWGIRTESFAAIKVPALFITGTLDKGSRDDETPEWRRQAFDLAPEGDKWLMVIQGARMATFTGRLDSFVEEASRTRDPVPLDPRADPREVEQERQRRANSRGIAAGQQERALFGIAKSLSLAFWDAYLMNDATGREHLDRVTTWSTVEAKKK
jgi:predicted dienelactone hydrolase